MKTKNQLRQEFNLHTWELSYRKRHTKYPLITPALFDAGKLGFCILFMSSGRLSNFWFDKPIKLS